MLESVNRGNQKRFAAGVLAVKQGAEIAGIDETTMRRWITKRWVPAGRNG